MLPKYQPPYQTQSKIYAKAQPSNDKEAPTTAVTLATSSQPAICSSGVTNIPTNANPAKKKQLTNNKNLIQTDKTAATFKTQAAETPVVKPPIKTTLTKAPITTKRPPGTSANAQVSNLINGNKPESGSKREIEES